MRLDEAQSVCAKTLDAIERARGSGIPDALLDADQARISAISQEIHAVVFSFGVGMLRRILANPDEVPSGLPEADLGIRFFQYIAKDLRRTAAAYGVL